MTDIDNINDAWRQACEPVEMLHIRGRAFVWRERGRAKPYGLYPTTVRINGRMYTRLREAAKQVGYAYRTLSTYCWEGRIECAKWKKCWFVHVPSLRAYIAARQSSKRAEVMAWIKAHRDDGWKTRREAYHAMYKAGTVVSVREFEKIADQMAFRVKRLTQRVAEYVVDHNLRNQNRTQIRAEVERGLKTRVSETLLAYALRKVDHEMKRGRQMPDRNEWLTVEEAARRLNMWLPNVRRLAKKREISQQWGPMRRRYYSRASIEAYIQRRCALRERGVQAQIRRYFELHPDTLNERPTDVARRMGFHPATVSKVRSMLRAQTRDGANGAA